MRYIYKAPQKLPEVGDDRTGLLKSVLRSGVRISKVNIAKSRIGWVFIDAIATVQREPYCVTLFGEDYYGSIIITGENYTDVDPDLVRLIQTGAVLEERRKKS